MDVTIERLKKRIKDQTPHPTRPDSFMIKPTIMVVSRLQAKKDIESLEFHHVDGYCERTSSVHIKGKKFWRPISFFLFAE